MTNDEAAARYYKIAEFVTGAAPHRNAERREAWRQIVGIVNNEEVAPLVDSAEDQPEGGGVDLSKLTVVELRAHAETFGIDLGDATKKVDILAAIEASSAEDQPEGDGVDEEG